MVLFGRLNIFKCCVLLSVQSIWLLCFDDDETADILRAAVWLQAKLMRLVSASLQCLTLQQLHHIVRKSHLVWPWNQNVCFRAVLLPASKTIPYLRYSWRYFHVIVLYSIFWWIIMCWVSLPQINCSVECSCVFGCAFLNTLLFSNWE